MTNRELADLAAKIVHWPAKVPLQTRLEIVKARATMAWLQVQEMATKRPTEVRPQDVALYRGDSNGAAMMLRCIDQYANGTFGTFSEDWAVGILRANEALIKEIAA